MIDLDQLEQRLDLALEAELRRHIGLDQPEPPPAPPPPTARRSRRRSEPSPPSAPDVGATAQGFMPSAPAVPQPSMPSWLPPPPATPSEQSAWNEQRQRPVHQPDPAPAVLPPPVAPVRSAPREDPPREVRLRVRDRKRTASPLLKHGHRGRMPGRDEGPTSPEDRLHWHAREIVGLVGQGHIYEADEHIAAHAALAEELGDPVARRDAAAWATMRALLDGRHRNARRGVEEVRSLGEVAGGPQGPTVADWQRFWLLLEWGTEREREDLLDSSRQRSYWNNELQWRGALTLLLARMGYTEEAGREFDVVVENCMNGRAHDGEWLDIMTNAGEAAALLNDVQRCRVAYGALGRSSAQIALVGRAWVCKGSTSRVLGQLAAAIGRAQEADRHLGVAMDKHRDMEALPLLARTCAEWGKVLVGRNNRNADEYLDEALELATRLRMTDLALAAQAGLDSLRHPAAS